MSRPTTCAVVRPSLNILYGFLEIKSQILSKKLLFQDRMQPQPQRKKRKNDAEETDESEEEEAEQGSLHISHFAFFKLVFFTDFLTSPCGVVTNVRGPGLCATRVGGALQKRILLDGQEPPIEILCGRNPRDSQEQGSYPINCKTQNILNQ
jgi:hypothetical protein